jgi:hypothetical protein
MLMKLLKSPGARIPAALLFATGFLAILPAIVMLALGDKASLSPLAIWLKGPLIPATGIDSWVPINNALAYVDNHPATGLYQETYFNSHDQFIYSPISLVLFKFARFLGVNWASPQSVSQLSWFFIPAVIVCDALLLRALVSSVTGKAAGRQHIGPIGLPLQFLLAALSVLFFYPLIRGYTLGQIQTWLTFGLVLSFVLWFYEKKLGTGIALGLIAAVKPHIGIAFLWALVRREWRMAFAMGATAATLTVLSLFAFGIQVHFEYLDLLSYLSKRGESFHYSHSVESMLLRLTQNGNNLEWDGTHTQVKYVPWLHWIATASSLVILALPFALRPSISKLESQVDYSILLLAVTMASPVAYEHHYGVLTIIFLCAGVLWLHFGSAHRWTGILLAICYALSTNLFPVVDRLADSSWNVLQSYLLWSSLLMLALLYRLKSIMRTSADCPS